MTIKEVSKVLKTQMYTAIATVLVIIVLFESELIIPGVVQKGSQTEFLLLTLMEVVTICAIPLALRLFKFKFVSRAIAASPAEGLQKWGVIRMALLCDTMVINTLLYYITPLNVAFGYMAIICVICLLFVNPTVERCEAEADIHADTQK